MPERIPPRSGTAFVLRKEQTLRVIDPTGEQVSDLLAFSQADVAEAISSGRSLDYAGRIFLSVLRFPEAAWQHAFNDVTTDMALAFAGTNAGFIVCGVPIARDSA
jgi:uncharacterized protein YcgI (DUF1989 family)